MFLYVFYGVSGRLGSTVRSRARIGIYVFAHAMIQLLDAASTLAGEPPTGYQYKRNLGFSESLNCLRLPTYIVRNCRLSENYACSPLTRAQPAIAAQKRGVAGQIPARSIL